MNRPLSAPQNPPTPRKGQREREFANLREQFGRAAYTHARLIDVGKLLPPGCPTDGPLPGKLESAVIEVFDDYLADNGWFWRASATTFGLVYPGLSANFIELKHKAIEGALHHAVARVLGGRAKDDAPKPPQSRQLTTEAFAALCRKKKVSVGNIHPLNLSEALFGEVHSDFVLSKRIKSVVRDVLDDYMSLYGYYTVLNDVQILLVFPNLGKSMGELKRNAIAMEIARRLNAPVRNQTKEEAGDERLRLLRQKRGRQRRAELRTVGDDTPNSRHAAADGTEVEPDQRKMWDRALAVMSSHYKDSADLTSFPEDRDALFAPTWQVHGQLLSGHVMEPAQRTADGAVLPLPGLERKLVGDDLDLPMIAKATGVLRGTDGKLPYGLLIVPVDFRTLERPSLRNLYLEICSGLDDRQRRLLVFELIGVPGDLAPFLLEERLALLRPFCRTILVRIDFTCRDFSQWKGVASVHALGIDLAYCEAEEGVLMKGMDGFVESASAIRIRTYIGGLRSTSLTTAAVASGVDYLSGEAIAPATVAPTNIRNYEIRMLYS